MLITDDPVGWMMWICDDKGMMMIPYHISY